jgi:hypothetical protein
MVESKPKAHSRCTHTCSLREESSAHGLIAAKAAATSEWRQPSEPHGIYEVHELHQFTARNLQSTSATALPILPRSCNATHSHPSIVPVFQLPPLGSRMQLYELQTLAAFACVAQRAPAGELRLPRGARVSCGGCTTVCIVCIGGTAGLGLDLHCTLPRGGS